MPALRGNVVTALVEIIQVGVGGGHFFDEISKVYLQWFIKF
jgi:hypothetical protein